MRKQTSELDITKNQSKRILQTRSSKLSSKLNFVWSVFAQDSTTTRRWNMQCPSQLPPSVNEILGMQLWWTFLSFAGHCFLLISEWSSVTHCTETFSARNSHTGRSHAKWYYTFQVWIHEYLLYVCMWPSPFQDKIELSTTAKKRSSTLSSQLRTHLVNRRSVLTWWSPKTAVQLHLTRAQLHFNFCISSYPSQLPHYAAAQSSLSQSQLSLDFSCSVSFTAIRTSLGKRLFPFYREVPPPFQPDSVRPGHSSPLTQLFLRAQRERACRCRRASTLRSGHAASLFCHNTHPLLWNAWTSSIF